MTVILSTAFIKHLSDQHQLCRTIFYISLTFLKCISPQCCWWYQTFIDSQFDQFQLEETQRTGLEPKSSHLTANSLELIKYVGDDLILRRILDMDEKDEDELKILCWKVSQFDSKLACDKTAKKDFWRVYLVALVLSMNWAVQKSFTKGQILK